MSLTLVVTSNVEARYRGFLRSLMLELAPGIYIGTRLNTGARDRLWEVVSHWHSCLSTGTIVMVFRARGESGGIAVRVLGTPKKELVEADDLLLAKR